jgi:hypothetical protein
MCYKYSHRFLSVFGLKTGALFVSWVSVMWGLVLIGLLVTSNQLRLEALDQHVIHQVLCIGIVISSVFILVAIQAREMPALLFCGTCSYILIMFTIVLSISWSVVPRLVNSIASMICFLSIMGASLYFCLIVESYYMNLAT